MHHKITYLFILFISSLSLLCGKELEEEIVVRLPTAHKRLPIYVGRIESDNSDFSQDLLDNLRNVLTFDLNYNGFTEVVHLSDKNLEKLSAEPFSEHPDFASWKKTNILYLLKLRMEGKSLLVKISAINGQTIKLIEGISLSGDLSKDRRTAHLLSDTIYQMLFQKQGIACSRILYTKKLENISKGKIVYSSELFEADYDGANIKQITFDGSFVTTPQVIQNGSLQESIVWVSYKIGQPKLYFAGRKDGMPRRVSPLRGNQFTPGVSPDGSKIAFASDATGSSDLFIQNFQSEAGSLGKPIQIFTAKGAANASPTFSPDGNKIAFVSNKDGSPKIYVMNIPQEGEKISNIKVELISKKCRENTSPAWSPDGQKIAFSGKSVGPRQIWIYDFSSNEEHQLTQGNGDKENPSWAQDSLHLLFNTNHGKSTELYLVNLNQPEAVQITNSSGEKRFPCWLKH